MPEATTDTYTVIGVIVLLLAAWLLSGGIRRTPADQLWRVLLTRMEVLEKRQLALEGQLQQARAELESVRKDRDALALRVKFLEKENLDLRGQIAAVKKVADTAAGNAV